MSSAAPATIADPTFVRSRLGSLVAVVPLGLWVVVHVWNNVSSLQGAEAWQSSVTQYPHPIAQLSVGVVALLPLVLHAIWGIGRLWTTQPNNRRYRHFANLKYVLQRISAVGVLLFVGAHVWLAMLQPRLLEGHAEPFSEISHEMRHNLPTLAVYLLGTLGVAYHMANGLHSFTMGWGVVGSRRALRRLDNATIASFLLLLALSWAAIYGLWAAGT